MSVTAAIFTHPDPLPTALRGGVAVIGNFDGVHAGHRALFDAALAMAGGAPVLALTFSPHTLQVLRPETELRLLMTDAEKHGALLAAGANAVGVLPFAGKQSWAAERFVQEILMEWLGARGVCVGEGFKFGAGALGTVAMLKGILGTHNVTAVVPVRDAAGEVVSSSRLRAARDAGR